VPRISALGLPQRGKRLFASEALKKGCDVDQLFNMAWVETTQDIRQSFAAIERVAIALDEKQTLTGAEFSALISSDLALAA
jgi:hypothetical protein